MYKRQTLGCSCPEHPAPVIRAAASVHIIDIVFMYFYPDRFVDLAEFCEIRPAVNQVETHVFHQQEKVREVMEKMCIRDRDSPPGKKSGAFAQVPSAARCGRWFVDAGKRRSGGSWQGTFFPSPEPAFSA